MGQHQIFFGTLLDIEPLRYMNLTQNRHLHPITLDHKCPEFVVNVGSDPSTQFVRPRPVLTSCIKSATSQGFSNFSVLQVGGLKCGISETIGNCGYNYNYFFTELDLYGGEVTYQNSLSIMCYQKANDGVNVGWGSFRQK